MSVTAGPGFRLESKIPEIIALSETHANEAVEDTLIEMEDIAKENSRVDTGQMRDGWEHHMTGDHEGVLQNAVEHVIYNEFGTIFMSPQPMMTPAIEQGWPHFQERMGGIYGGD
jgi:HK97 gp10 family phage protein